MKWVYDDGGRRAAGYKGGCGDCVARSIAIAAQLPYDEVYRALAVVNANARTRKANGRRTARSGVWTKTAGFRNYMGGLGWRFVPTMGIGTGCTVHLLEDELPMGRLIVSVSKHYTAVIDRVIYDTHNPSADRGTTIYPPGYPADQIPKGAQWLANGNGWAYAPNRCVYGYWVKA